MMDNLEIDHSVVPRRHNEKLAIWIFLGGEVVLFLALITAFAQDRVNHADDYEAFRSHLNVPLVGLNTVILIVSSYLVVRALEAIRDGSEAGLKRNLIGVVVFGALFLGGQAFEWAELFASGVGPNTAFGSPFLTLTGIHGTHVLVGLMWAALVAVNALGHAYTPRDDVGVDIFGLYWHFVDIVWIVLFTLIYLL
jgi:heme/copper-type cytochrome/quinol oxidase subunit 3